MTESYCQLQCEGIYKADSTTLKNCQTRPNYIPVGTGSGKQYEINARICSTFVNNYRVVSEANQQ